MSALDDGWSERVKLAKNSNFREILCFLSNAGMRIRAIRMAADVLKIPVLEARDYVLHGKIYCAMCDRERGGPISLNAAQEQAVKDWAANDSLWTTQETVEFNLRTFARVILKEGSYE